MSFLRIVKKPSFFLLFLSLAFSVHAQTATINAGTTYQTISGWGASTGVYEENPDMTAAQADCFFLTTNGSCATGNSIGLTWIRIQDNQVSNNAPDLATLQLAVARGASVELSFQTDMTPINSSNFASTASYDVGKIQYFQSNGVPIAAISPENEPGTSGTTATDLDTFVASYLWPAMNAAGLGSIPLTVAESADWFVTDYVTPCMNDVNCSSHVQAVSGHAYYYGAGSQGVDGFLGGYNAAIDYAANPLPSSVAGKPVWQTELNGGAKGPCPGQTLATWDPSMQPDALTYAHNIHDFLTVVNGSQWLYWNLNSGYSGCNDGITDYNFNPAKRFYAIGNWSRFVRPGWVRIAATASPQPGVYVTAFKSPSSGAFAIVSINSNNSSVSQPFSLTGLSTSSLTPWITSATQNLIEQPDVSVSNNSVTYTLPALSVTTLVAIRAPNPPVNLNATVTQ